MNDNKFYITTTLPYVNASPHIGFALEMVQADIIARHKKLSGCDVFFNTGTDEHGLKIYKKSEEEGRSVEDYINERVDEYRKLMNILDIADSESGIEFNFIRTTDPKHVAAAGEFWKICDKNGYIDKRIHKAKYCIGCELEKTDSELEGGKCPEHPNLEIEIIEEENYFFLFEKFRDRLLDLYKKEENFVIPEGRLNEIRNFVSGGLKDFSISRLKEKMPWGVGVPGDSDHVMFVWFDALVNYISAIGWPDDLEKFNTWHPHVIQIAGKDNLRQQSAIWQAMLMAAGLEPSKKILIHGFIISEGHKMSKSFGNVIDPFDMVRTYGTDALRYYLAREVSTFEDSDFTEEHFKETYNANLANGLGNLVSRIMKMATSYGVKTSLDVTKYSYSSKYMDNFEINKAIDALWSRISDLDSFIQKEEPFKAIKTNEKKAKTDVVYLIDELIKISIELYPFMPDTSKKIQELIKENKMPEKPLFARIE